METQRINIKINIETARRIVKDNTTYIEWLDGRPIMAQELVDHFWLVQYEDGSWNLHHIADDFQIEDIVYAPQSKAEIRRNTTTTQLEKNIFLHQYESKGVALSVRTYRYGARPADQVETSSGQCVGLAANKDEFIDRVHSFLS